ncbi:quinone oxidoreductase family protein [Edaphobacter aggregans]|uniref:quinone oxidoreductase family protein n=1 Tax=Edaphobacter aggregans TaxID=570835 RepID=UPI00054EABEC|nr:zinc-binding dehydrogenase [Edaphobacter aggregans]
MKFIEAPQFGGPEVLTLVETETPTPGEGMLLVEVKAAGLNYADIMARSGFYPQVPKAPFALGFEIAGVVTGVGKGVEGFKEGDSVAAITLAGGGYATHAMIPAATAIPLPTGFNHALAVALLVQGLTAYILLDEARVKEGDAVLIAAAGGGLGNIAVQLAKARGAKVIGLTSRSKFELVKNLGADHVADYEEAGWAATVKDKIGEKGIQVYLDSIGDLATEAFPLLGQFAQWIIFGVRSGAHNPLPVESTFAMVEKNITLRGFNLEGSLQLVPQALSALFKAVAEGRLKVEAAKYPLSEAVKVHQLFEARKTAGKVVFIP